MVVGIRHRRSGCPWRVVNRSQPGEPAIIHSSTNPTNSLRWTASASGVLTRSVMSNTALSSVVATSASGERQHPERAMGTPCRVGHAERQGQSERTEVAGDVRRGTGGVAEHEWLHALRGDHDRDPGQRGSQPTTAAQPRRTRPVEHAGGEIRQRLDTAEPHGPRERRDPLGIPPAERAPLEVVVEQPELGCRQFVVDGGRDQFSSGHAFHTFLVDAADDSVPADRPMPPIG